MITTTLTRYKCLVSFTVCKNFIIVFQTKIKSKKMSQKKNNVGEPILDINIKADDIAYSVHALDIGVSNSSQRASTSKIATEDALDASLRSSSATSAVCLARRN